MVVGIARLSNFKAIRWLAEYLRRLYSRNTAVGPNLLGLLCSSKNLRDENRPIFAAVAEACSINSGAYVAEIFRSGIQSIDKDSSKLPVHLGLNWFQSMKFVIMPQAFKRIIRLLAMNSLQYVEDSSLVSVIGFEELTRTGQMIISRTYAVFEVWMVVAILLLNYDSLYFPG